MSLMKRDILACIYLYKILERHPEESYRLLCVVECDLETS